MMSLAVDIDYLSCQSVAALGTIVYIAASSDIIFHAGEIDSANYVDQKRRERTILKFRDEEAMRNFGYHPAEFVRTYPRNHFCLVRRMQHSDSSQSLVHVSYRFQARYYDLALSQVVGRFEYLRGTKLHERDH